MTERFITVFYESDTDIISALPCQLCVDYVVATGDGLVTADTHLPLNPLEVGARCLGAVVAHADSQAPLERALATLAEACGLDAVPTVSITDLPANDAALCLAQFVTTQLNAIATRQAQRIAGLSRALTSVRTVHDETLSAFQKIEAFVSGNNLNSRTPVLTLAPNAALSVRLEAGQKIVQRLPVSSVGLSDIEIHCAALPRRASGIMTVVLRTLEDDMEHAFWTVEAEEISGKPLRLCLPVALSSDTRSPVLELSWEGSTKLTLECAMAHPDTRFQAQLDDQSALNVLAMRVWTYLPGATAPLPVDGIVPAAKGSTVVGKRFIDSAMLATAVNITPESANSEYIASEATLQVHPMPDGISAMCISGSIPAGAFQVSASIHTASDQAQDIEYALALLPVSMQARLPILDQALPDLCSDWVVLKPGSTGEVNLFTEVPLAGVHDLVLMTRLASRPGDAAYGWARFDNIRASLAIEVEHDA